MVSAGIESAPRTENDLRWYCLRDLKRSNAKLKGYQQLAEEGFRVFTPLKETVRILRGRKVKSLKPFISDLLFVHSTRESLDPAIRKIPTLQYRFVKGGQYLEALTVPDRQMEDFIKAATLGNETRYLNPGEIKRDLIGKSVRVIGGPLDAVEGKVLSIRGKKNRRVLIEIQGLLSLTFEVTPDLLKLI